MPLLMPASIKMAIKGTSKSTGIIKNKIEYGNGYKNAHIIPIIIY